MWLDDDAEEEGRNQRTAGAALRAFALNDRIRLYMKPGPGRGDKVTSRCFEAASWCAARSWGVGTGCPGTLLARSRKPDRDGC
jgi:hypothetical protein